MAVSSSPTSPRSAFSATPADGLVGRQFEELLVGSDDPFEESFRRRSIRNMERRFAASDGSEVDLMMSLAPVVQHGEPAGVVILGRDMRDQKDAEREVRRAVTLLESTLESTADGILVIGDGGRVSHPQSALRRYVAHSHRPARSKG